ncbi:MAG: phospholipase D-like domain-containing protein [Candidatus Dormibacteraeota bacterium]|nr:phospholipase D-like domain-containing protein [Candidatus Dormibacteraeota bacterium]
MSRLVCALGPDSAGTLLHRFVRSSTARLDVAVYEAGPSYGWMFPLAVERGVRVRLLLDGHGGANRGCLEELRAAAARGVDVPCRVRRHDGLREAHWKLLVADSDSLAVGTGNLIERDAPADRRGLLPPSATPLAGTREWWAFVEAAPTLAASARSRITAAWREATPPPPVWAMERAPDVPPVGAPQPSVAPLEIEISPRRLQLATDARAVRTAIEGLLEPSSRRCLLTVPYIHTWAHEVRPLLQRLMELRLEGADVRVLLGVVPADGDAATLRDRGLPARVMDPRRCTTGHAKGLVVDNSALVMSSNWSAAGLGTSLEAGLRIDNAAAAAYYAEAFERDWAVADPAWRGG